MKNAILASLFLIFLSSLTHSAERIKIARVEDTNRFMTVDGRVITLSNVETISIIDPDSFRRQWAATVFKTARKKLQHHWYEMEIVAADSVARVHLWQPLPFGRESINSYFLRYGWGSYVAAPPSDLTPTYEKAALVAQRKKSGLHNPARFAPVILPKNAFWLSGGPGVGVAVDHRRRSSHNSTQCLRLDGSLNVRYNWFVWTGGCAGAVPYGEFHSMKTWYMLAGKSFYGKYSELALSVGPNLNRWWYNTESERGTVSSDWYPGAQFKIQVLAHLPVLLGLGFSLDGNINKDISYYTLSMNVVWGDWFEEENKR